MSAPRKFFAAVSFGGVLGINLATYAALDK
jgi:hypothetical protein